MPGLTGEHRKAWYFHTRPPMSSRLHAGPRSSIYRWWLVERTYHWGVGCMAQGDAHLSGADASRPVYEPALEGDALKALGDEGAEQPRAVHGQAAELVGGLEAAAAALAEIAIPQDGVLQPAQSDRDGALKGGGAV